MLRESKESLASRRLCTATSVLALAGWSVCMPARNSSIDCLSAVDQALFQTVRSLKLVQREIAKCFNTLRQANTHIKNNVSMNEAFARDCQQHNYPDLATQKLKLYASEFVLCSLVTLSRTVSNSSGKFRSKLTLSCLRTAKTLGLLLRKRKRIREGPVAATHTNR